ncbi:ig-like domain-containing protein [Trichonephila clavata]|uniref:Ig-like domain-containing protein n=1 Tax=Trichonephila clavata TaxID=2740835 RepID=A0A8X6KRN0_TRICU|nr:ig-like domain-containing protein [Trichonephila clavata]
MGCILAKKPFAETASPKSPRVDLLCLKLREIVVPAVVIRGEPVWLNCTYDLGNETLYSIKWHKNNVEFYRYLPEDRPPGQKYELAGIHLDLSKTDRGNIYMPYTDVESEGIYRCEVSTEAPNFQTVKAEREMRIYDECNWKMKAKLANRICLRAM